MTDIDKHYCKFCHEEIIWGKDANGKPSPRNIDGSPHRCIKKEEYREVLVKGSPAVQQCKPAFIPASVVAQQTTNEPPVGATGAKPPVLKEKETPIQSSMNEAAKGDYVSVRERLIVYQTVYKSQVENIRELLPIPEYPGDFFLNEKQLNGLSEMYDELMDMVLERVKKDAKELIACASRP